MDALRKNIALTDIETSGLDPEKYEIIEIGLVLFSQSTLNILDTFQRKVVLQRPEVFDEGAQRVNGYKKEDWTLATPIESVMEMYAQITKEALFCAYNVTFDWPFVNKAFQETGVKNNMDYHRIDLMSVAWFQLAHTGLKSLKMKDVANHLGIPEEPLPHRALNGALTEYEIYKELILRFRSGNI